MRIRNTDLKLGGTASVFIEIRSVRRQDFPRGHFSCEHVAIISSMPTQDRLLANWVPVPVQDKQHGTVDLATSESS